MRVLRACTCSKLYCCSCVHVYAQQGLCCALLCTGVATAKQGGWRCIGQQQLVCFSRRYLQVPGVFCTYDACSGRDVCACLLLRYCWCVFGPEACHPVLRTGRCCVWLMMPWPVRSWLCHGALGCFVSLLADQARLRIRSELSRVFVALRGSTCRLGTPSNSSSTSWVWLGGGVLRQLHYATCIRHQHFVTGAVQLFVTEWHTVCLFTCKLNRPQLGGFRIWSTSPIQYTGL